MLNKMSENREKGLIAISQMINWQNNDFVKIFADTRSSHIS